MEVKDLINSIAASNAVETESAFNAVMSAKVSNALENMRVNLASSMFKQVEEPQEVEEE